jgi:hypothetical protein
VPLSRPNQWMMIRSIIYRWIGLPIESTEYNRLCCISWIISHIHINGRYFTFPFIVINYVFSSRQWHLTLRFDRPFQNISIQHWRRQTGIFLDSDLLVVFDFSRFVLALVLSWCLASFIDIFSFHGKSRDLLRMRQCLYPVPLWESFVSLLSFLLWVIGIASAPSGEGRAIMHSCAKPTRAGPDPWRYHRLGAGVLSSPCYLVPRHIHPLLASY